MISRVAIFLCVATGLTAQTSVLTSRNDNSRDGLNRAETILNQSNVAKSSFGKVCSAVVDGQIFAQPLVGLYQNKNAVLVATMNDSLYILDGTNCKKLAQATLLPAGEQAVQCTDVGGKSCSTFEPILGILGTPVVDLVTKTAYFVTESESTVGSCANDKGPECFVHRMYAFDLLTLKNKFNSPVTFAGSYSGLAFTSYNHIQRPGLLLLPHAMPNGDSAVYVAFSEMNGTGTPGKSTPQGWIFGFDAGNLAATPYVWSSTPQAEGGGIWQSGAGLAAGLDSPGGQQYIYFNTGDGVFDVNNGGSDYGDSFVKLTTSLANPPNNYFTPFEQACMNSNDRDFGSGGVTLLPNSGSAYYAVSAGKEGNIYVLNRANPGGYSPPSNDTCPALGSNNNQEYFAAPVPKPFFTTPAYWNQQLYYVPIFAPLIKFQVNPTCNPGPICNTGTSASSVVFTFGTNPSVSANGSQTGTAIVWAADGNGWPSGPTPAPATLYALDAEHAPAGVIPELWDSTQCPNRDAPGNATKYVVPSVANGFVYLGAMDPTDSTNTRGQLDVFGLTNAPCN